MLSEILAARVCGGSKFAKKKMIRKMLDLTEHLLVSQYLLSVLSTLAAGSLAPRILIKIDGNVTRNAARLSLGLPMLAIHYSCIQPD